MQFLGVVVILIGLYLGDSAVRNRPPIGFLRAIIDDPSDLSGTLEKMNGTWSGDFVTPSGPTLAEQSAKGADPSSLKGKYENGKLPRSALQVLSFAVTKQVAKEAAPSLEMLNQAYRQEFGKNLYVTSGYRSLAGQVATKAAKGFLAATPGKSNHGWGLAVDLGGGVNQFGTKEHEWMKKHAGRFGWVNPSWARQGGSKPEPWHWEYVSAGRDSGGSF